MCCPSPVRQNQVAEAGTGSGFPEQIEDASVDHE